MVSREGRRLGRRAAATALATVIALGGGASVAAAAPVPGDPGELDADKIPGVGDYIIGVVQSPNRKCLSDRTIVVTLELLNGKRIPFDVARSGKGGGWMAIGPPDIFDRANSATMKLRKRTVGAIDCGGARVSIG